MTQTTKQPSHETTAKQKIARRNTGQPVTKSDLKRQMSSHGFVKTTLAILVLATCTPIFTSCKISTFYPMAGAVVGGGAGSLGGPVTGAVGAGTGYAVGELAKNEETANDLQQVKDKVEALTKGDIEKLVELELKENNDGFFETIMSEVWGLLKLVVIGLVLWNVVPILYSRYLHKKQKNNE